MMIVAALAAALGALAALGFAESADAKRFKGTGKADRLVGTNKGDKFRAKGGNDRVRGRGGKDKLFGAGGKDKLNGNKGNDKLFGGKNKDKLKGGGGNDKLIGGGDVDVLLGGSGNDVLRAIDGVGDTRLAGGGGKDVCKVDFADVAAILNCETVKVRGLSGGASGGGGGGGGGGGLGGGEKTTAADPLKVTSSTGLSCAPVPAVCEFTLAGTGADTPDGEVTSGGGVVALGAASAKTNGEWTASGSYTCAADGSITVRFGFESITVQVDCEGLGAPESGGDSLTVTSSSGLTCEQLGTDCQFTLAGTGADEEGPGVVTGTAPALVLTQSATANADGTWTATGTYTCALPDADPDTSTLTVAFAPESVAVDVTCTAPGGPLP